MKRRVPIGTRGIGRVDSEYPSMKALSGKRGGEEEERARRMKQNNLSFLNGTYPYALYFRKVSKYVKASSYFWNAEFVRILIFYIIAMDL